MAESTGANQKEKPTKSRVKPARERVAQKQLASIRRGATANELVEDQAKGGGILQQRAAVRPVSGDAVSRVPVSTESRFAHDFSRVPTHTVASQTRPVVQAQVAVVVSPIIQRVRFGHDGTLPANYQATVRNAAQIAEPLVRSRSFHRRWTALWRGSGANIRPRPSLAQYQAAVRRRVIHDMDNSTDSAVSAKVRSERSMPRERQTAAVTPLNSVNTYIRRFAIAQGVDSVVSLILHESLHGAGLPEGPVRGLPLYELIFHAFEADVGFPMMMGGADILDIRQVQRGNYHIDVTITYNLRQIGNDPLPQNLEIHIVHASTGDLVHDERPPGQQVPARHSIPSRVGQGRWVWQGQYPGWNRFAVRIRDLDTPTLLASRQFDSNPRCVLGVSRRHCR